MFRIRTIAGLVAVFASVGTPAAAAAGFTGRVSLSSTAGQADSHSAFAALSADGRFVAFESAATNLVAGDANGASDIYVRDRQTGTTTLASVSTSGAQADNQSGRPAISADGRFVAFESIATNLVSGEAEGRPRIFVRDRQAGTTTRVSVLTDGTAIEGSAREPAISADGRFVAFTVTTCRGPLGVTCGRHVHVRDRQAGTTTQVDVAERSGDVPDGSSAAPAISADGRFVAFSSTASNLVAGDTNESADIFVRDLQLDRTTRESLSVLGEQVRGASRNPAISADGRFVAFDSESSTLVGNDGNGATDVFVRDRQAATVTRVSVEQPDSAEQTGVDASLADISRDGRFVVFSSPRANLVAGDRNASSDVFLRDRQQGTTRRVSESTSAVEGNDSSFGEAISPDGRIVAFRSSAAGLVANDTNGAVDVFVHDHLAGPPATVAYRADSGLSVIDAPGAGTSLSLSLAAAVYAVSPLAQTAPPIAGEGCAEGSDARSVRCALTGGDAVGVQLGDGLDRLNPAGCAAQLGRLTAAGGDGGDTLSGGPAGDALRGDAGSDALRGCGGGDLLDGGAGTDTLTPGSGDGADLVIGGTGTDTVVYSGSAAVNVSIDDAKAIADDGPAGEGDEVRSDVENVTTAAGADVLTGNAQRNTLRAGAGDDRLAGGSEADGASTLGPCGGLSGVVCGDTLDGGPGVDTLLGEGGDDLLITRDGEADAVIDCGDGTDTANVDLLDTPSRTCENLDQGAVREGPHVRLDVRRPVRLRDRRLLLTVSCPRRLRHACAGTLTAARSQTGLRQAPVTRYRVLAGARRVIRMRGGRGVRSGRRAYIQSIEPGDIRGEKTTRRLARIR